MGSAARGDGFSAVVQKVRQDDHDPEEDGGEESAAFDEGRRNVQAVRAGEEDRAGGDDGRAGDSAGGVGKTAGFGVLHESGGVSSTL